MENPVAFFCRAKPQGADAFEVFRRAARVFIGYPLIPDGNKYDPRRLKSCIVDPTCSDDEWHAALKEVSETREYTRNRNFVREVVRGSIVTVPRPSQGVVYVARVVGSFEIIDNPPWAEEYLNVRMHQGLDVNDVDNQHTADVAQGWPVDKFIAVPLSSIPGWIRHSLFGRSTYGLLQNHPLDKSRTAWSVLNTLIEGKIAHAREWTLETDEIKSRLVDDLNTSSFEHLVVSILQLEFPEEVWMQTGGPGDGGVDGLGSNGLGTVTGLLQCKLNAANAPGLGNLGRSDTEIRRYAAVLIPENPSPPNDGTVLLDLPWITERIRRHWRYLPQAQSMRVGISGLK